MTQTRPLQRRTLRARDIRTMFAAGCVASAIAATACGGDSTTESSPLLHGKVTFEFTGNEQSFVVPAGVRQVTIKVWGAGGGGGRENSGIGSGAPGAAGGFAMGTLGVSLGDVLTIIVGEGGAVTSAISTAPTFGGGGGINSIAGGAKGGGRSAVRNSAGVEVITAGGGGGGGPYDTDGGANAGGGGGGSGYIGGVVGGTMSKGVRATPPNTTDADYAAGRGVGGAVPGGTGGHGRIVISY